MKKVYLANALLWKVWLAVFMVFIVGISTVETAAANAPNDFKDVASTHWAKETILWGAQNGIVNGYPDGTFQPSKSVSEPEFLSMLFKAFPEIELPETGQSAAWYQKFYQLTDDYNWPVLHEVTVKNFSRGHVARIIAATQGTVMDTTQSIQFLLDNKLANGKTANTIAGFGAADKLTRAEALVFIKNVVNQKLTLNKATAQSGSSAKELSVRGISVGNSEQEVLALLGSPARKDASEYGFSWYIYNQDYSNYVQVGIENGVVVALFSNSDNWSLKQGLRLGSESKSLSALYGNPLEGLIKNNTIMSFSDAKLEPIFAIDDTYVTIFLDRHNAHRIMGVLQIEKKVEDLLGQLYGKSSQLLRESYEKQVFDIANATRANIGKAAFAWDDIIAGTARKHSADMVKNRYFNHTNLNGQSPFDRMKADGIEFRVAAENLAAGQRSAIHAHMAWMNSLTGHRDNILNDAERLGVGIEFGGDSNLYYTQNFYTPR